MRSKRSRVHRAATLLLLLMLARSAPTESAIEHAGLALNAGVFDPPGMAPEFSLHGSDGAEVTLTRYRGKVVLMPFGFTSCAVVCPVTLATLADARGSLGPAADAMQVIFVTVDPERDDVPQMKNYLEAFDPSFVGATGE